MSGDFRALVRRIAGYASVAEAHAALRVLHGAHAARWLAGEYGVHRRTGQRWMSTHPPASRIGLIMESVSDAMLAAQVLRRVQEIRPGTVKVRYDDQPQGKRTPPSITVKGQVAALLHAAADALEADNMIAAEKYLSEAIMYGYEPGLEETLTIAEYVDGPEFDLD